MRRSTDDLPTELADLGDDLMANDDLELNARDIAEGDLEDEV